MCHWPEACRLKWNFLPYPSRSRKSSGCFSPARRRQYAARLPSDVIAKQMMGLRFDTEVDNTAKSGRGPQGLPAPDDLLTSIRHDLDRARARLGLDG